MVRQLEQLASGLIAADVVEVASTDQIRVDLDTRGFQRRAVPVDAGAAAQHHDRAPDHRDSPVPEPEQMPGRR